jgi:lactoylglutathione lyase
LTNKPFAIEIGFVVDDVEKIIIQAKSAGAVMVEEPKQKPWGQTVVYLRDTDGFLIEVCTPVG